MYFVEMLFRGICYFNSKIYDIKKYICVIEEQLIKISCHINLKYNARMKRTAKT